MHDDDPDSFWHQHRTRDQVIGDKREAVQRHLARATYLPQEQPPVPIAQKAEQPVTSEAERLLRHDQRWHLDGSLATSYERLSELGFGAYYSVGDEEGRAD